jgi:ABC-type Mn2+/Zn2+ transport system permease subunit
LSRILEQFLAAWTLFGNAWTTGLLLAALLPILGVVLVAREQIFVAAAVSQAATLGIATATWLGATLLHETADDHLDSAAVPCSLLFAVAGMLFSTRSGLRQGDSGEARAGIVFLAGGSLSMLLLASHPHGLAEVQHLMFSSLLGASRQDVWIAAAMLLCTLLAGSLRFARWRLWVLDPTTAQALGVPARRYALGIALASGLAIGFSIHCAGALFTFGICVLPALIARRLARTIRATFLLAPALGVTTTLLGLVAADALDLPPGQLVVALLCTGLAAVWLLGRRG